MKNYIKTISIALSITLLASAAACSNINSPSGSGAVMTADNTEEAVKGTEGDTARSASGDSAGAPAAEEPATDSYSAKTDLKSFAADSITNAAETPRMEAAEAAEGITADDITYTDEPYAGDPDEPTVEPSSVTEPSRQLPEAGQLTAGEWNDNNNWGFFTNLVNAGTITFPSYGLEPRFRTAVTVTDNSDKPIANAKASLLDKDGNVIWKGITGKNGNVYLFSPDAGSAAAVEIEQGGKKQSFEVKQSSSSGDQSEKKSSSNEMTVKLEGSGSAYKQNEIMFILDTTGSMGDEMLFLQSEFSAIAKEIGTENTKYSVNFYRDEGDDYVTKCFDFTDNVAELQQRLNSETADGGGDIPEAVADILTETINKSSWSEQSVKLAFLILDAPPHDDKAQEVAAAVKKAAEKGIRIVPVVSSNSERNTELFARAAAIMTGGTYVFLTDDSGIGDSHLEPIIGDYKVEKLYDIIIRVINEYKQ